MLPPKISKKDLCGLLKVTRIRCLRKELITDDFILTELQLDIATFNRRQQFSIVESVILKKYLLEKVPDIFREQQNI